MMVIYGDESFKIIGACFEVYNQVGCGFDEPVYQECLEIEFRLRGLPCVPQVILPITYKGQLLQKHFKPDFCCYDKIILEIKSVLALDHAHRSQVHNYLKATGFRVGLLVNFGARRDLEHERIVC
jgi:GxxExxY protein